MKPRSEHLEQTQLVARIRQFHPDVIVFAIPNGGKRSKTEAIRLKAEGVLAGIPDLFVAEPRGPYDGLFVETKRVGGKPSKEQVRMLERLRERGFAVMLADTGVDAAFDEVERYLSLESRPTMRWQAPFR